MRLIVTRPAAQARAWVDALHTLGCDAVALPLINIAPAADPAPVRAAWLRLADFALVMFVSANAVEQFFALQPTGCNWPADVRAGATGPGTAAALHAAGLPDTHIVQPPADAPSFDSEALWAQVAHEDWAGRQVLVVRGEGGRDWLADTLHSRGAHVEFVTAYRRLAPQLDAAQQAVLAQALAQPASHLWLFSSSEAVTQLCALAPGADWPRCTALATHPRIAAALTAAGFGHIVQVAPDTSAVAQAALLLPGKSAAAGPSIQFKAL